MKNFFLTTLFFWLFLSALCVRAQQNEEQKRVNTAITGLFDGIATLDENVMKRHITDDFLLLEDGAIWTIDTLVIRLSPLKSGSYNRINLFDFIRTEVTGNTAWVAYHNAADITANGRKRTVKWLESASLIKKRNSWRIKLLHSTRLRN